jgi:aspartate/glutamate racemase
VRTAGIVGGLGPGSTPVYRRLLHEEFLRRRPGCGDAPIVVDELGVPTLFGFLEAQDLAGLARYFADSVERLARSGAAAAVVASRPALSRSSLPLPTSAASCTTST